MSAQPSRHLTFFFAWRTGPRISKSSKTNRPVSFTPGFSQVNWYQRNPETVLNGFLLFHNQPITRLKPGVNESPIDESISCA